MGCFAIQNLEKASVIIFVLLLFFSCFSTKSYRMTSFATREAMTTAEPPEPSRFRGAKSLKLKA